MNELIDKIQNELYDIQILSDELGEQEETTETLQGIFEELSEVYDDLREQKTEQEIAEQEYRESDEFQRGELEARKENEATGN